MIVLFLCGCGAKNFAPIVDKGEKYYGRVNNIDEMIRDLSDDQDL
ncbi:hypothetical protein NHE_0223 [Neorickettsia helminthoeca str. Oregon]|uniref:Uncharacterized protein n=1 Tax=Neorickettsia helminthoeca str. Oregon TaxID=1286528 RepID=X5GVT6_9RICK|nr:hypothetical protein NHE_0223 [Neorickettsia helminthoeca str. Oregon]